MKVICDLKGWTYSKGVRAAELMKILRNQGLFPEFADQSFDQLIATLTSGLPTVRNETGGHGQGRPAALQELEDTVRQMTLTALKLRSASDRRASFMMIDRFRVRVASKKWCL
jgi:hypothetical protein